MEIKRRRKNLLRSMITHENRYAYRLKCKHSLIDIDRYRCVLIIKRKIDIAEIDR